MNQSPTTIESIIQNVLRRRADGERIDDEAIINAHPELMPRLGIELKKLQLIAGARDQAAGPARADDETINRSEEMDQEETDAPPAEDLPEMEVPDYELLRFLGRGGFGAVYLGRHRIHGEFSAIKIFSKSRAAELDGVRAYKQRAQTNPHLVPIEHVGELAEAYYYVMPLADDLREGVEWDRLRAGRVMERELDQFDVHDHERRDLSQTFLKWRYGEFPAGSEVVSPDGRWSIVEEPDRKPATMMPGWADRLRVWIGKRSLVLRERTPR